MAFKLIDATSLRVGGALMIEGDPYTVKSMDVSKTGKHGHAKVRLEANSLVGGKKKIMVIPGHERFEVPMINKRKAQVLSINGDKVNLMDSENFENFDLDIPEGIKNDIQNDIEVEFWDIEGRKILKRAL
jgi:translation initiation factor 5A